MSLLLLYLNNNLLIVLMTSIITVVQEDYHHKHSNTFFTTVASLLKTLTLMKPKMVPNVDMILLMLALLFQEEHLISPHMMRTNYIRQSVLSVQ